MTSAVSFHEGAERELNEAGLYYRMHGADLAGAFLDAVEEAVRQVVEFPEASPIVKRLVRRKLVRRFPYSIFYSFSAEKIRILAVAHQKRRPFYWIDRR